MKPKKYTLAEVFNNTEMGFSFEFYSSKNTGFIVENLSHKVVKDVILTNDIEYEPSYGRAILLKEYNGKKPKYSFKIAKQRFDTVIPLVKEVLSWISETSDCTHDTVMKVNMSFDHNHLRTLRDISNMNVTSLILKINEDFIYDRFPTQKNSPYAMSIKTFAPISEATYIQDLVKNVNYIIGLPKGSFYGVNFEKYTRGILEFNYIGGVEYSEKQKEIMEVLEYYVLKTYQALNETEYTPSETLELKKLTEKFYKVQDAYYEPDKFSEAFPDIQIAVNMRRDSQLIKTYWHKIRNTLIESVVNNNLRKGEFNYDSDIGVFQLRNAKLNCNSIKGFDLVKCELTGVIQECNLIMCDVNKARLIRSKVVKGTDIKESYLNGVTIESENTVDSCLVENNYEVINCEIINSVVKFAVIGKVAKLDEGTVIIDREEFKPLPEYGVKVEETRDYRWFKDLLGPKPEGHSFGNEYNKKTYLK